VKVFREEILREVVFLNFLAFLMIQSSLEWMNRLMSKIGTNLGDEMTKLLLVFI
jgi:hypothetical protein